MLAKAIAKESKAAFISNFSFIQLFK